MKKLKKFKRFSGGGLGSSEGEGDPFAKKTDFAPGEGDRNIERIKGLFGFGKKEAAPIEERAPEKVSEKAKPSWSGAGDSDTATPAKTSSVKTPSVAQQMADREKGGPNERANYASVGKTSKPDYDSYHYGPDYMQGDEEGVDSRTFKHRDPKKAEEYRQSLMPGNKPKPAAPKAAEKTSAPAAEKAKPSYVGAGDSDDSDDTKKKNELERLKRVGSGAVESVEGPLEMAALGAVRGARAAYGLGKKAYDYFTKPEPAASSTPASSTPAAKPTPKSEPKQGELFDAKGNPTAEATGAKPAPKSEPKEAPKSGAIQPTGKGPSEAGRKAMEESKGSLKDQAKEAINKQRAADKDSRGPISGAIKPTGKGPSEAGRKLLQQAGRGKPESLKEQTMREINRQRAFEKDPRGLLGGKPGTLSPLGQRAKDLIEKQREADKYPGDAGVDKVLERHALPAKKGGKIPAFKKGGLVGRGDGCAQRGRTKGRMV